MNVKSMFRTIHPRLITCLVVVGSPVTFGSTGIHTTPVDQNVYDEIVVTARKRQEQSHQVPIAITAFGREQLQSPLLEDISNLGDLAPNVDFNWTAPFSGSSNAASVFIRGVGQNDFLLTTDPGVGIYLDGVYISRSVGGVLELTDIERVEVLRGPQGTLFGKNSIGGAIQVISRKPSEAFQGEIQATTGDYRRRDLVVSAEGRVMDNMQGRISVSSDARDGYVERLSDGTELGDIDRQSAKAVIAYQPSDRSEWLLSLDHTKQRQEAIAQTLLEVTPMTFTPHRDLFNALVASPDSPYDDRWLTGNTDENHQDGPSQDDLNVSGASLSLEHDFDWGTLTAISGYRRMSAVYARDSDASPYDYAHSTNRDSHKQFSQEFRVQGIALEDKLNWLAGVYYSREHGINQTEAILWSGLYAATGIALLDSDFDVNNDIRTRSGAVFSQISYAITEQLSATAGLRVTREKKAFSVNNRKINSGEQVVGPATVDDEWTNSSPMVSLDYRWTPTLMSYLSYSRGFKSGGFNGRQIFPGPVDRFDPEFAATTELGLKALLWDGRVNIQASLFDTDYEDMQFTVLDAGVIPVINNAAEAGIKGGELELALTGVNGFSARAGIGYLDARYESLDPGVIITEDMDLVRVPRWNVHADLSYSWGLDNAGVIRLAGNANYKSKVYHDPTNVETIAQDGLTLVNASLDWRSRDEAWGVGVFVTNLTDKRYFVSGASELASLGISEANYAREREWGLQVNYKFK